MTNLPPKAVVKRAVRSFATFTRVTKRKTKLSPPPLLPLTKTTPDIVFLTPDPNRLLFRFFVPGREDVGPGNSRAGTVIERIMALDDAQVQSAIAEIDEQFPQVRDAVWRSAGEHADLVSPRIDGFADLDSDRQRLIGAAFTHQFAVEGASVCNPSMVLAPGQAANSSDGTHGTALFVMSVRGVGEGHQSSIGFRSGSIDLTGRVSLDPSNGTVQAGVHRPGVHHRRAFRRLVEDLGSDAENAAFVVDPLGPRFDNTILEAQLTVLAAQASTRKGTAETIAHAHAVADSSYGVHFAASTDMSERVLWPRIAIEHQGMEDARFVRFTEDDGSVVYYATYTAFDGRSIAMQLIETTDFADFLMTPLTGLAATGKGLALFPRRIGGRYYALTRADRETNSLASSEDLTCWDSSTPLQAPIETWEILQLGNCGSPIETSAGWLVLTHGVGAMRTYAIGAILLDLHDPSVVIGRTQEPLIRPRPGHGGGYVPNVVYSCGGMLHGDRLVIPYGVNDQSIAIASFSVADVLTRLTLT